MPARKTPDPEPRTLRTVGRPFCVDNSDGKIQRDLLRPICISSLMASDTFLRDRVLNGEQNPERH